MPVTLITRTQEYVTLHDKRGFADSVNKVIEKAINVAGGVGRGYNIGFEMEVGAMSQGL